MPLGIKPIVDFAFKKIFGTSNHPAALVGLLNAILDLQEKIAEIELLNPFSYQDFADDKLIVLDIRARDVAGRWLNIEMQLSVEPGLRQRLVYYACSLYTDQLHQGDGYSQLRPAISICLLCDRLFPDTREAHHRFRLTDVEHNRVLDDTVEVHTVELTKYNLDEASITDATAVEQWAFFLRYADRYEPEQLRNLLPAPEFQEAIASAEAIRQKTEDRIMYDQREKAQRDYLWVIESARLDGLEKGRKEGRKEGMEKGEQVGLEKGALVGKIQLLRELLGDELGTTTELSECPIEQLSAIFNELQARLRSRGEGNQGQA